MRLIDQNILFIVRTMGLGGTENVVLQLCEILTGKVNKIVVCSTGGVHEVLLKKMGIVHYTIPDVASKNPIDMVKSYLSVKSIIRKEQITMIHSHHRMAAFYAELAAPRGLIKVANAHNTFQDKTLLTKFAYGNTELIAVGNMVKKNLVDYFKISDAHITVIHNAVKPFDGKVSLLEPLVKAREAGYVLVGNVGRLSEQKGMQYFIEAADIVLKTHPEVRFYIVGDGEEKEFLQNIIKKKNLSNKVFLLGYRNDIQNIIIQLDFIVLSSLWEGLPLTPIEAYSVGKTVIGTAVDGTPEIIRDSIDGYLVEPKNPYQLSQKIIFLAENPNVRKNMENKAKERYFSEFSFSNMANKYIAFYKRILYNKD